MLPSSSFNDAHDATFGDLNNDGYMDVVGVKASARAVNAYFSDSSMPPNWTRLRVHSDFIGNRSVSINDLDLDGDLDIIGITNDRSNPMVGKSWRWFTHTISETFSGGYDLDIVDLNGDTDIIAGAATRGDLYWWETTADPFE
jgi:hypothetical protein